MIPIRDNVERRRLPAAVFVLAALNGIVFLVELSLPPDGRRRFLELFGLVPARYTDPAWAEEAGVSARNYWPFLTSMFLHAGWLHLLGNMWTLWIFGATLEDRLGARRFLVLYGVAGIVAGLTHAVTEPGVTLPTVGASGAIAGVMGAYLILFPRARVLAMLPLLFYPVFFELPAVAFLGLWIFTQLFSGAVALVGPDKTGGVAWWAHVGGFAIGATLGILARPALRRAERGGGKPPSSGTPRRPGAWAGAP